jgi:hypothetical protein
MGNKNSGLKNYEIPFNLEKEESQYWLGYICADGNVQYSYKYRVYTVSIGSIDLDIIKKAKLFFGNRCHYHFQKSNNIHIAYVNSRQLCEYLINLNIVPNKSLILDPYIKFTPAFLRGYFDGDGSLRWEANRKSCKITCGSEIFIKRIQDFTTSLGIYSSLNKWGNAYYLQFGRKSECKKFLHYIYDNSTIYLDRKYNLFVALVSNS